LKITSITGPEFERIIPRIMPIGVANENVNTSHLQSPKLSGKVFTSDIPRELEAAPLWIPMAISILTALFKSLAKPVANPSKIEWTDRAIIRTNGVMFGQQEPALRSSLVSSTGMILLCFDCAASKLFRPSSVI